MQESDILYSSGGHWVCVSRRGAKYGYEVYRDGITHATRVAIIGYQGDKGLQRAIAEVDRRIGGRV